jgi:hypothetical protein
LVAPVDGVVFEEVGQVVDVGDVIDRDEVELVGIQQDLQCRPADAAQSVDGYVRHLKSPLVEFRFAVVRRLDGANNQSRLKAL